MISETTLSDIDGLIKKEEKEDNREAKEKRITELEQKVG